MTRVKVSEIYPSIQGESTHAGKPCVFIRLTGCPLRCRWCDTTYAFEGGDAVEVDTVVERAAAFGLPVVEVTGGEPLAQRGATELLQALAERFDTVLLETAGSHAIDSVDPRVHIIMDLKAPGSGEVERNRWENLPLLRAKDEVKFVLADRADYEWAKQVLTEHALAAGVTVLFSPVHGELNPQDLASWMVDDGSPAILQLQQHKYIWGADVQGV